MSTLRSNWQSNWPRSMAPAAGTIVSVLGLSVLVAWHFYFLPVVQVKSTLAPMHRMTALEFVLAGLALALVSSGRRRAGAAVALAMLVPALLAALEYILQADFGVDEILGRDTISPLSSHPGRLSPITTLSFLAGSLSLLVMSSQRMARRAAGMALTVGCALIAVGVVVLLAYLGHTKAYGWGYFSRIAIHTGAGHLLVGCGLTALAFEESRGKKTLPQWLAAGIGLGLAIVALGGWQALIEHEGGRILLLSRIILVGGVLGASLVAVAVYLMLKARRGTRELQEGKERLRELFDQGPIGIALLGMDRRFSRVNAAFCRMLGYSEAELTAMTPLDITFPEDRMRTMDLMERLLKCNDPESKIVKRYVKKTGEIVWGSVNVKMIRDRQGTPLYVMAMIEDITERKRVEDELRSLSQRVSLATRSASMGVWDWDLNTERAIWDDMMFQIFGIPKKANIQREDWKRLVHPDDLEKTEALLTTIVKGNTQDKVEFRIVRPDGSLRYVAAAGGPVPSKDGKVSSVVGIATDITDAKLMSAQVEASRQQMAASARLSALGVMAGGVAHEINNPLAIIHALASDLIEVVKEEGAAPPAMVARSSRQIRETAERIARIVKSLRKISREGSKDQVCLVPVSRILEETLEICEARFKAHSVQLILPEADSGLSVSCREVQIEQVLLNLLQNAFDAVAEKKGERWVRVDVTERDRAVVISVTDSGPGIPAELQSRVGEPFFTTKEVGKGTGLGLSLSKTIAEEHGGSIEYEAENGHTRFSLVLPLVRQAEAA